MAVLSGLLPLLLLVTAGFPIEGKQHYDKYDPHYHDYPPRQNYYNTEEKYRSYERSDPRVYERTDPQAYERSDPRAYGAVPRQPSQKIHTFIADYGSAPPPHDQVAKMARYIVHTADWAAISTHSSAAATRGFPFANVVSISDGPINNSSGVPYMYITPMELSTRDLEADPRCSLALSLAETDYCKKQNIDPEDPRCARVILTGKIKRIKTYTSEIEFAENALFSRHPAMRTWPQSHGFYFVKIKIEQILVLDYYGGPKIVPLPEYFNPTDARLRQ